jgi:hypothetical protein
MKTIACTLVSLFISLHVFASNPSSLVKTDEIVQLAKKLLGQHKGVGIRDLKAGMITTTSGTGNRKSLIIEAQFVLLSSKKELPDQKTDKIKKAYTYRSYIIQFDAYKPRETILVTEGDAVSYDYF